MDVEEFRQTGLLILCLFIIYFVYTFSIQAHFMPYSGSVVSPEMSKHKLDQERVTYMQSGDFYPMSWQFPRLLNQIRHSTRLYRADNFMREFGNYGPFDIEGVYNRLHNTGNPYPDPVGSLARP